MRLILSISFVIFLPLLGFSQVPGCTDPQATNFQPSATVNNGSCLYNATAYTPPVRVNPLSDSLPETSGLAYAGGYLWTINDRGSGPVIYRMDTSSNSILQRVIIPDAYNNDWEEITTDGDYLYIGDFGNNLSGNRTDLRIYRIPLDSIPDFTTHPVYILPTGIAGILSFTYSDQPQPPAPVTSNSTAFDCEAMIADHRRIHLFTKNWTNNSTTHYTLSGKTPGQYTARPENTLATGFLVTGAAKVEGQNCIALLGYQNSGTGRHFLYLLSDYKGDSFFTGHKRLIDLPDASVMGQAEGICFRSGKYGYISNERFTRSIGPLTLTVPQQLRSFSIQPWIPDYFSSYRFNGNGAWSLPDNWLYGLNPPGSLPTGNRVTVDPAANGQCVLDQAIRFSAGSWLDIQPQKTLLIPGNLVIQ